MDDYNDFFQKTMQLLLLEQTKKTITKDGLNQLNSKKFNDSIKCEVCPITLENFNENDEIHITGDFGQEKYLLDDNAHFNQLGHEYLAEVIEMQLKQKQLIQEK